MAYASDESGSYPVYVRPFPGPGAQTIVVLNWTDELRAAVAKGVRGSLRD